MKKKLLSCLVVLALTISFLSVQIFAVGDPIITVSSTQASAGQTVTLDVSISNNPGINTFSLGFNYDTTRLNLTKVEAASELGGQFTYSKKAVWLNSTDSTYNGKILTLTFQILENAAPGEATVAVTYNKGDISNYNEDDVDFSLIAGKVTVVGSSQNELGTITVESKEAQAGDTVLLDVSINNNPGINTFSLGFNYDTTRLSLISVEAASGLGGQFTYTRKAVWLNSTDTTYNGKILTLTFQVIGNAAPGEAPVAVTYNTGDISNYNEDDIEFDLIAGKVTVVSSSQTNNGTITVASMEAQPGDTVSLDVSINNNPGINTFSLGFDYDTTRLSLTNVEAASGLGGQFTYSRKAVWLNSTDSTYNGKILTLTFKVLANAASGDASVAVTYSKGDISNYNEDDVDFELVAGNVTVLGSTQPEQGVITVSSKEGQAGDVVTLDVSISNNPGINTFSLGFDYDTTRLRLMNVEVAPELGGQFTYANKAVWLNSTDSTYSGKILTLTFQVLANAASGDASVAVTYNKGDISNYNEDDLDFDLIAGKVTVSASGSQFNQGTISVSSAQANIGETVTLDVSIENNPGINTFSLGFNYDKTRLSLLSVDANAGLGGQFTYSQKAVWLNSTDTSYNGKILTLTFKVNDNATAGEAYVAVTYNTGDISNYNEDDVDFDLVEGKVTVKGSASYSLTASHNSPQTIGTPITLTATGGSSYRFYCECNEKNVSIRKFSAENTCVWTPTIPGDYMVYVDIKDETGKLVAIKGIQFTVADAYSFTLDKENEQNVGVNVTLTAAGGASYKFYYEYNGAWCNITSNTTGECVWSPKYAGNYLLYVDIKDENGKVVACRTQTFKLNDPFSLNCDANSSEFAYGNTVNFTADGGTSYKFYYEKQGEWQRIQDFSTVNTCAWTPAEVGKYNFYVDIKDATGAVVSCKRMTFNITNPYSFTADKATTQSVGTKITFTATGGYQYKFYYEKDGSWVRIQSFSTANTCAWTPTVAGRYNVYCDIADENSTVLAYKGIEFVIGDVGTDSYSFTTSVEPPQPMNNEVTLTASGGSSYKFYYEVGGKWATIRNFSATNTCAWTPDMIADYTLYVDIKNSSGKVVKTLSKKFSATDCYSFTSDAASSENIGKTVRFTATGGASYKFYYQYAGAWIKVQDSASATCDWKPNKAGEYMVYVDIKDASGTVLTCRTMKLMFIDPFSLTTSTSTLTQPAGTAVTLLAKGGISYKFYYEKNGKWAKIQDFSDDSTCTWIPTEVGKYNVYCDMKDSSGAVAVCKRLTFIITEKCTFTASKTSASVGDTVTLVATGGASYQFYYEKDGSWTRIQSFSEDNTCAWELTETGDYVVYVDINDASGNLIGCKGIRCSVR